MTNGTPVKIRPWRTILWSPRSTIRQQTTVSSILPTLLLVALGGTAQALTRALSSNVGLRAPAWIILVVCIGVGSIIGLVGVSLESVALHWVGRLTRSEASFRNTWLVVCWANMPWAMSLALWLPATLIAGRYLYVLDPMSIKFSSDARGILVALLWLLVVGSTCVSFVWSTVILIQGLAEVNGFSAWRGLFNLVASALLVAAVVTVLVSPFLIK